MSRDFIQKITAPNGSMFTGSGTNSYLIGKNDLTLVDPGPKIDAHIEKLAEFSSSTEAFDHFEGLGDNAIPPILPKFIKQDGKWIGFFPGEEGYENV